MTAETYDDLKMYVGSKDDFTTDLLNMGYTKGKKDGRAEVIEEIMKSDLCNKDEDWDYPCITPSYLYERLEQLKEQR